MELKIESIIDGCNDTCLRNQGRTCQSLEGHQCLLPSVKRKRLSEAVLSLQTPCQARHVLINTCFNFQYPSMRSLEINRD